MSLVHHSDEGLPRRQAFGDLNADRARFDGLGEALHDGKRDVGVEQCEANLPDGVGNIILAQAAAAGKRLQCAGQARCEAVEHNANIIPLVS